jgi:hypothetical protein
MIETLTIHYSQTCVQRPPLGPEKSGRLTEVSDKTEIYRRLVVDDSNWPLLTGGVVHRWLLSQV